LMIVFSLLSNLTLISVTTTPPPPTSTLFPYTTLFRSPVSNIQLRRHHTQLQPLATHAPNNASRVEILLPAPPNHVCLLSQAKERSEEHTSELQSQSNLVCRLLLEKKKNRSHPPIPSRL